MQTTPDETLIGEIRIGNEAVFEGVFRQYYAPLCRYASPIVGDTDEAEEVVQSVFVTIWERRESLLITTSLKAYLYRAVHNRCLNRISQQTNQAQHRQQAASELYADAVSPTQALLADELSTRLQRAIGRLPEQCRRAFELSRFEELSYKEIADQLGIATKTVENQIGKALRILRTELSDCLPLFVWLAVEAGA
ncbi:RNA polymerase sigma-70 factor [Spirosoma montaniterrae]|uniref:RNA polymerase subunit sigma-24 n=1 Tax=Spirosoma montaniterrae TaxID=1178516 RepID=A0A1P9WSL1_9BACT|nr:RNA polymerase sigma-70 factor [Spirosoma montaniterrae]AQG78376.1 RNA polymerase subunit sigma-24 [Spirosoma montaniterrae]